MAAYWVVRVNVLDTKKLQAYAPLAAAAVEIVWWPLSGAWRRA